MVIELHAETQESHAKAYVIRRGARGIVSEEYFQCFADGDNTVWISTPCLARHFPSRFLAAEAQDEIRRRSKERARRRNARTNSEVVNG